MPPTRRPRFRSGFTCALLAAGCSPAAFQALTRWSSDEPLNVYARLIPSDHVAWITKAPTHRTD